MSGTFTVNHSEIRRQAVLRGLGISIFPEFTIQSFIDSDQLIEILPQWHATGNYQGDITAQYAQSKYIPSQITAFIKYLQDQLAQ